MIIKTKSKNFFTEKERAERRKEMNRLQAKGYRDYLKSLSEEDREQIKRNKRYDKEDRESKRQAMAEKKENKLLAKRELIILQFMFKSDVLYYHHGRSDSLKSSIEKQIERVKSSLKEGTDPRERDSYIWNYYGEGSNYMFRSQLGNLYSNGDTDFDTIHDVPLDGSYNFSVTDSGQRGLGSFNYIKPVKSDQEVKVPFVNPGCFPPISY